MGLGAMEFIEVGHDTVLTRMFKKIEEQLPK
jgi:hypothetical protein